MSIALNKLSGRLDPSETEKNVATGIIKPQLQTQPKPTFLHNSSNLASSTNIKAKKEEEKDEVKRNSEAKSDNVMNFINEDVEGEENNEDTEPKIKEELKEIDQVDDVLKIGEQINQEKDERFPKIDNLEKNL